MSLINGGFAMALEIKSLGNRFWYGCTLCGFEYPKGPVPRKDLGPPPNHDCPNEGRFDMKTMMEEQTKES